MIFSRSYFKYLLIIASIAASAMCVLPLMSVYSGGTESCTLIVRGFNLMEFSAWGVIPLIAPLVITIIVLGRQTRIVKETEILILFMVNTVSYVHSFNAAKAWLYDVGDSFVTCYPWAMLLPLGFVLICVVTKVMDDISQSDFRKEEDEYPF